MMRKLEDRKNGGMTAPVLPAESSHDGIALKLKELYSSLEGEGIPQNLLSLLDKLDAAEKASGSTEPLKGVTHE